jgi:hypothetical protein
VLAQQGFAQTSTQLYLVGGVYNLIGRSRASQTTFKVVYCVALIPGAAMTTQQVYDAIDSLFFLMAVPNIIGIYLMAPEVRRDLTSYVRRLKRGDIPTAEQLAASREGSDIGPRPSSDAATPLKATDETSSHS